MYPWSNAIKRAHDVMVKQRDMYPMPASCTDAELRMFWESTLDTYDHYVDILSMAGFETEEAACLNTRLEELEITLEELDYEWNRRPWLH
jgi:hypothetical protein